MATTSKYICSHIGYSVNEVNSLHGFCMDVIALESTYELAGEFSVDGLAYVASKLLNIKDDAERVSGSVPLHHKGVFQMKDERQHCSSTPSLHNPVKPVSAMKGSREKRGVSPPKKLTVKWAPNVYDPIPAPSLHMAINRPRNHGSKKKYKSKQKTGSKSSSGSKGKDKKQVRKSTGFKLCEHKQQEVSKMQPSAINFCLAIPDLFRGGSFVNQYVSSFHHSSAT